jgi:spermidine synthase
LVDVWWLAFGEYFPDWGEYSDHGRLRTRDAFQETRDVAKPFEKHCRVILHVGHGAEYLATFPDHYFDWVYIDSSHSYEATLEELRAATRKVKSTGLITGHDWEPDPTHRHHGVYRAIQAFIVETPWEIAVVDRCEPAQWCLRRRRA